MENGKTVERQRRKATGLLTIQVMIAGLPNLPNTAYMGSCFFIRSYKTEESKIILGADLHQESPMITGKSNENINVVLVDRDQEWCCHFARLLQKETDIHLINTSATKEEAMRASLQLDVDVVVVNATLQSSERDGLDATKAILAKKDVPVITVASSTDPEVIVEAITVGAVNFINKADIGDIVIAIREAYYRRSSLHPRASRVLREELIRLKRKEFCCKLTTTEKEVLQLIGLGHSLFLYA